MERVQNSKFKIQDSRILVTGGAGFVGSQLVSMLLSHKPSKIYIIDNLLRGRMENMAGFIQNPVIEFYQDDIRNNSLMKELVSRSDYIFHLAALRITRCAENPSEAFSVMAEGTFNLIENARQANIKKIIYSSSASVYGLAEFFPTPETNHPYDNKTIYGGLKLFGEQVLRSYFDMYGLNYIALRYFNVYGPGMDTEGKYTEVMIRWLECIKNNKIPLIFGDGSTTMDFVYVGDVAAANILALESEATDEVFNIGCRRETSLAELLNLILKINHSDLKTEYKPERIINPVSRRLADTVKAKKMLNFEAKTTLEEGLKLLSEWYFKTWANNDFIHKT